MKNKLVLTLALLIALAGQAHALTVLCNGDSNTGSSTGEPKWCEMLGAALEADTINRGVGGSTITDQVSYPWGIPSWAGYYIDFEVVGTDPFFVWTHGADTFIGQPTYTSLPAIDVAILAYGTNDINAYHFTVPKILQALKKYRRKLAKAGAQVYVATVPPIYELDGTKSPTLDPLIQRLNKRIRGNFPKTYIEFYEGFTWEDYNDRLHLNAQGHEKRALAALEALSR